MDTSTRIVILIVKVVVFGERNEERVKERGEICTLLIVDIFEVKSSVLFFHFITQSKCHQAKLSENYIQKWNYHGNQLKIWFPC